VDLHLRTCADAAYNHTSFPTPLEHRSWEAVESSPEYMLLGVIHFLLEGQCNPDLRLLGCSVLAPRCEGGHTQRPCRHVCEGLREACQPAFDAIDMAWPYFLDCAQYFAPEEEGCYDPLEELRGKGRLWGYSRLHISSGSYSLGRQVSGLLHLQTWREGQLIKREKCPIHAHEGSYPWRGLCSANK
jgi:hypothetical protein